MNLKERKYKRQVIIEPDTEEYLLKTKALYERITGKKFFMKTFVGLILEKGLLQIREELQDGRPEQGTDPERVI